MAWVKLDDQIFALPKNINLSRDAKLLYLAALAYCGGQLTVGLLRAGGVHTATVQVDVDAGACAAELIEAGLRDVAESGDYVVNDDLDDNPSGAQVRAECDWSDVAVRLRPVVLAHDGCTCQYCGATDDLTLDHIIPRSRGGNSRLANLRTACHACNSAKGARTPGEWRR
ncbi:MAG TPA: HNH endonuclease [Ktedonobacterales bacterium]|nr:HNH endonuclease [Ktedonobacterales bacterium]